MIVYKVHRPFVSYGMYHAIGEVIQDASLIDNFCIKIQDGTLEACDSGSILNEATEVKPTTTVVPKKVATVSNKTTVSKSVAPKVATHTTTVKKADK